MFYNPACFYLRSVPYKTWLELCLHHHWKLATFCTSLPEHPWIKRLRRKRVVRRAIMVVKHHIAHISSSTRVWVRHVRFRMLHFTPFCCFLFAGKTGKMSLCFDRHVATKWLKLWWYDDFAPKHFRVDLTWLHPTIIKHVVERKNIPHPWYRPSL